MDHLEDHHMLQTVEELNNKLHFLKRILQLLISFSLFSMFLVVPIPSTSQFPTSLFSLLSRTLERKYMFLICNGILAFLARTFVSSASSSPSVSSALDGQLSMSNLVTITVDEELPVEGMEAVLEDDVVRVNPLAAAEEEEADEKEADKGQVEQEIKYVEKEENEGIQEEEEKGFLVKQEIDEDGEEADEDGEEANEEVANTEELNRRIEEFIRKMKEEIRNEARQQLIAV